MDTDQTKCQFTGALLYSDWGGREDGEKESLGRVRKRDRQTLR